MSRALIEAAYDALEYFEDRSDVVDGDEGRQVANHEMTLAMALREALEAIERRKERNA